MNATEPKVWNPRYLAYCRAHNMTPDEMLEHDKKQWPGGCMCGYMQWNSKHWDEYAKLIGATPYWAQCDQEGYDRWLLAKYP